MQDLVKQWDAQVDTFAKLKEQADAEFAAVVKQLETGKAELLEVQTKVSDQRDELHELCGKVTLQNEKLCKTKTATKDARIGLSKVRADVARCKKELDELNISALCRKREMEHSEKEVQRNLGILRSLPQAAQGAFLPAERGSDIILFEPSSAHAIAQ